MRVGLDVDEVVAQLHVSWLLAHNKLHGTDWTLAALPRWDDYALPTLQSLLTPSLYETVLPYPGTRAAIDAIRRMKHTIIYVTSCGPFNETAFAKERWLRQWGYLEEGQGILSGHMIPTQDKRRAPVDVLIDDHLKNVSSFCGWSILHNRIHNLKLHTNKQRINHLADFADMLWERESN